jgi:hypothetical protein
VESAEDEHNAVGETPRERLHARGHHHVVHEENGAGDQAQPEDEEPPKGTYILLRNCPVLVSFDLAGL